MPIIGTIASSTRQGQNVDLGAMFPLQVITVGPSSVSNITFTNIPNTYTHLQLRGITRGTFAGTTTQSQLHVNNDIGNNYTFHLINGTGSSVEVAGQGDTPRIYGFDRSLAANGLANAFGVFVMDVLDYANTNKFKTFRTLAGYDANGSGNTKFHSGMWRNTSAITSIHITDQSGGNFAQHTQIALYGIKVA